jgi:hypothetical protein
VLRFHLLVESVVHRLHLQCLSKGKDDMNAAGLIVVLTGVSGVIGRDYFQTLVTDGSIRQDELDGTRRNLEASVATLKNTPPEKLEALVAQYDDQLSEQLNKFNANGAEHTLAAFRDAQTLTGHVATILAKSGLKE